MKKTFLIVLALLFSLTACSDYYTEEYVESIRESYKDEISILEDRIAELEGNIPDVNSITDEAYQSGYAEGRSDAYDEGYNSGYDDGHASGYESGYKDGSAEGYNDGYKAGQDDPPDSFRDNIVWETINDYPEWLLDGDFTEFWGELYNALAAFWSGDTSDLSAFEDGLYDVILDIYAEYKADRTPEPPQDPKPPEDPPPPIGNVVYITESGTKYHAAGCQSLWNSKIEIDKSVAISKGYKPCSKCNP